MKHIVRIILYCETGRCTKNTREPMFYDVLLVSVLSELPINIGCNIDSNISLVQSTHGAYAELSELESIF